MKSPGVSRAELKWTRWAERKCPTSMKRKNRIGNWVGIRQEQVLEVPK